MGDYFDVDLGVLSEFADSLRRSTDLMDQALNAMRDTGPKTLGSHNLDHAADSFQDTWRYGLGKLKDTTKGTADTMGKTFDCYNGVETDLTKMFTDIANQLRSS